MLVLTRRTGESIYLGDDIKVTVLASTSKHVKLGFDVPESMTIYREEIYLKIKEQNRMAINTNHADFIAATKLWNKKQ